MSRPRQVWPIVAPSSGPRHRATAALLNAALLYRGRLEAVERLMDRLVAAHHDLERAAACVDDTVRQAARAERVDRIVGLEELRIVGLGDVTPGERAWFAFEALPQKAQDHAWAEVAQQ